MDLGPTHGEEVVKEEEWRVRDGEEWRDREIKNGVEWWNMTNRLSHQRKQQHNANDH